MMMNGRCTQRGKEDWYWLSKQSMYKNDFLHRIPLHILDVRAQNGQYFAVSRKHFADSSSKSPVLQRPGKPPHYVRIEGQQALCQYRTMPTPKNYCARPFSHSSNLPMLEC
ncbi:hypothetical protein VTL71DRAFT_11029 [Oculimacula yallundae]|uniref:Uncharacterized protein n=1 Tax=Oculimacula yallundae TaxID=86028 RepID=A0ABR4CWI1_9HELO